MNLDFTTVVGIDEEHLAELKLTWPTWQRHRPEILSHPLLLICDGVASRSSWRHRLTFLEHPDARIVTWNLADASQREKMLNGLVFAPARDLETPWYLKLDTDTVATASAAWVDAEWFLPDECGRLPCFVASPWGYTKPCDAIERLDAWGDAQPSLASYPRLNIHPLPGAGHVAHPRIISWCFFGQTVSLRDAAALCQGRLPVPSQDTFLWYIAKRRGDYFRRVPMKRYGWEHAPSRRRLERLCTYALTAMTVDAPKAGSSIRRSPSVQVATALARTLGSLVSSDGKGMLIDSIGDVTSNALKRQRSDWTCLVFPYNNHTASGSVPETTLDVQHLKVAHEQFDFIVIEAETRLGELKQKLAHLWPLLRPGGILAGINHGHPRDNRGLWGVSRALEAFARTVQSEVILPGQTVWLLPKVRRNDNTYRQRRLAEHPQYGGRNAQGERLAVVTCFFNPANDERIDRNYGLFASALASQGVELWTIEIAFGGTSFRLKSGSNVVQLRARSLLWQKERALNLLIDRLPGRCDFVAWVDSDLIFAANDWPQRLCKELMHFPLVQCWSQVEFLDARGEIDDFRSSTALIVRQKHPDSQSFDVGHPGLAWGARRDLLLKHGLYDRHVTGGGDTLMSVASFGWWKHRHLERLPSPLRSDFLRWAKPWFESVSGDVGVLPGLIRHLWHGSLDNRLYRERSEWLMQCDFNPTVDLMSDPAGLWQWATEKEHFHQQVATYFQWLRSSESASDGDRQQMAIAMGLVNAQENASQRC